MYKNKLVIVFMLTSLLFINSNSHAETVLRLSHQWPGTTGDLRHKMALLIQSELKKANAGISLTIIPKEKLKIRPRQQWTAMITNNLDLTIYPLAYAGPKYPLFNITLMPGIIRSHQHAKRFNQSKVMKVIKKVMEDAGVLVIADLWLAGGIASNDQCIAEPEDTKGLWMRSAGISYNQMLSEAGARISSMPSSKIRQSMKQKELDGAITSSMSLVSYKIYQETKCLIAPDDTAIWFMYEPVLIAKSSFDKLSQMQQQLLISVGQKAQQFGFNEALKADKILIDVYRQQGVTVKKFTRKQFMKWRDIAKQSSYKKFKKEVQHGDKLLTWALQVK